MLLRGVTGIPRSKFTKRSSRIPKLSTTINIISRHPNPTNSSVEFKELAGDNPFLSKDPSMDKRALAEGT